MTQTTGYSDVPLVKKLEFKPGETVSVDITPDWYSDFADKNGIELVPGLPATHAHMFFSDRAEVDDFLQNSKLEDIEKSLWVSWPKKSSGVKTDLTEQTFRDLILPMAWVDTKICAVDETWSGLKFLRRKP